MQSRIRDGVCQSAKGLLLLVRAIFVCVITTYYYYYVIILLINITTYSYALFITLLLRIRARSLKDLESCSVRLDISVPPFFRIRIPPFDLTECYFGILAWACTVRM